MKRPVVVALVKVRTQIVALKVSKNVLHEERLEIGQLQSREAAAIIHRMEECGRGGEEIVEDPVDGIVDGLDVRHAPVAIDLKILDVARIAPNLVEQIKSVLSARGLLVQAGLEIVQEVELQMVDDGGVYFIDSSCHIGGRGSLDSILRSVEHHARWRNDFCPGTCRSQIGIYRLKAHLSVQCAYDKFAHRNCPALREERAHTQVRIDALHVRGVD